MIISLNLGAQQTLLMGIQRKQYLEKLRVIMDEYIFRATNLELLIYSQSDG